MEYQEGKFSEINSAKFSVIPVTITADRVRKIIRSYGFPIFEPGTNNPRLGFQPYSGPFPIESPSFSESVGEWYEGLISSRISWGFSYFYPYCYPEYRKCIGNYRLYSTILGEGRWYWGWVWGRDFLGVTYTDAELDFTNAIAQLRQNYPPDEYEIIDIHIGTNDPDPQSVTRKEDFGEYLDINRILQMYSTGGNTIFKFSFNNFGLPSQSSVITIPYGEGGSSEIKLFNPIYPPKAPLTIGIFDYSPSSPTIWGTYREWHYSLGIPTSLTFFLIKKENVTNYYIAVSNTKEAEDNGASSGLTDDETNKTVESESGNSTNTDKVSYNEGLNKLNLQYGNIIYPFDSVYISSGNYNKFVSNGGGVISESGIFPQGEEIVSGTALYIEEIRLSPQGNYMTVIQVSKFDADPLLKVGERIYGYIINQDGDTKPTFGGYVYAMSRRLTDRGQEIVYECRCLKSYLNQYITPLYFEYRPPYFGISTDTKSLRQIVSELLIKANITRFKNYLPNINCPPVKWQGETIDRVLEWACSYAGNYTFYIDKNGILVINKLGIGSVIKSFRIPSEGEYLKDHSECKVLKFEPTTDYSLSRSRIILVGDYELTEVERLKVFSEVRIVDNMYDRDLPEGRYFLKVTTGGITSYTPFIIMRCSTNEIMLDKLLTASNASPQAAVKYYVRKDRVDDEKLKYFLSQKGDIADVAFINKEIGNSFIIFDNIVMPLSNDYYVYVNTKYATRSKEPIKFILDTGYSGGTEIVKNTGFKKIKCFLGTIDDTSLMSEYANQLKDFFKPIYGGTLVIDGLDTDLYLLGKLNITNTNLPSSESENLIIYEIVYNIPQKTTTIQLSSRKYANIPSFDPSVYRTRTANDNLIKIGMLEGSVLFEQRP